MERCSSEQIERIVDTIKIIQKGMREIASSKFKEYGFTFPQMSLMFILHKSPNIMLNELSDKMGLSKSTVSSLVERMESQGIVIREIPKDNRRSVKLSLSADFVKNHTDFLDFKSKFISEVFNFQDVSREDAENIISALMKLTDILHTNNKQCKKCDL